MLHHRALHLKHPLVLHLRTFQALVRAAAAEYRPEELSDDELRAITEQCLRDGTQGQGRC
jgi:hypothetical protein